LAPHQCEPRCSLQVYGSPHESQLSRPSAYNLRWSAVSPRMFDIESG
jgi:hypothetical protein